MRLLFVSFLLVGLASANSLEQNRINLEASISTQLNNELGNLLPADSYAVFTSVDLVMERVREIKEGEKVTKTVKKAEVPQLPGFEDASSADNSGSTERQVYQFVNREKIRGVNVRVVFDRSLSKDSVETAKALMVERLRASYGGRGKVQFSSSDLLKSKEKAASGNGPSSLSNLFGENLWNYLMIFAGVFVALLLLSWLLKYFLNSRRGERADIIDIDDYQDVGPQQQTPPGYGMPRGYGQPMMLGPGGNGGQQSYDQLALPPETLDTGVERLFKIISEDPLIAKNFLQNLDPKRRTVILGCFENSPLATSLAAFFGAGDDSTGGAPSNLSEEEKGSQLNQLAKELEQYNKLLSVQKSQRMGCLHYLAVEDIVKLLAGKNLNYVKTVLSFVPQKKLVEVVRHVPADVKKALFQLKDVELGREEIAEIERQLSIDAEKLGQEIFLNKTEGEVLAEAILEESAEDTDLLNDLLSSDATYFEKYKHYLSTFDDFVNDSDEKVRTSMEAVPNETLALMFKDIDEMHRERLMNLLPEMRRDIVSSLLLSYKGRNDESEIIAAKSAVLNSYRQSISL